LADVRAAISGAAPGDTVLVPAGSATWEAPLDLQKGILLIGAGVGSTIITRGASASSIISYIPSNYDLNAPFRLSGFTFNGAGGHIFILGKEFAVAPFTVQTSFRIDHNQFTTTDPSGAYQAIIYRGGYWGVVDNNIFDVFSYPLRNINTAAGQSWWDSWAVPGFRYLLGSANNITFEDNVFNFGSSTYSLLTNSSASGRYCFRYNTINQIAPGQPMFDMHGNQGGFMASCFGGEIYGNLIYNPNNASTMLMSHRGGKMAVFCNVMITASSTDFRLKIYETNPDSENPSTSPDPQYPNDGYYWKNIKGYTGSPVSTQEDEHVGDIPLLNRDYFTDGMSPVGISFGTLAARPATAPFVGYGYWATDQSLTNLTNYVGKNPATPIAGTLYKWDGSKWLAFYTPYPYPHPLRSLLSD